MIETLILVALAFYIGWKLSEFLHTTAMMVVMKELGVSEEDLRRLAKKNNIHLSEPAAADREALEEIHIKLEQHQGQIYAFRTDNDGFLGQGADRESLIATLGQRMNNVRLIVDEGGEFIKKPEEA